MQKQEKTIENALKDGYEGMRPRTAISYYGAKGMIVSRYPRPIHQSIVEPFAGGAAYSLKYYKHNVELYDLNEETCKMWWYYKNPVKMNRIPENVKKGMSREELLQGLPEGLQLILNTFINLGQGGTNRKGKSLTSHGATNWSKNVKKIRFWANKIKHWKIFNTSYTEIENKRATWFIDPPYQKGGYLYKHNNIDYKSLKKWCFERTGQKIICEKTDNDWIDVVPTMKKTPGFNHRTKACNRKQEGLLHIQK